MSRRRRSENISFPAKVAPWLAMAAGAATLLSQLAGLVKLVHELMRGW